MTQLHGVCDGSRTQTHKKETIRASQATINVSIDTNTKICLQNPLISRTSQMMALRRNFGIFGISSGSEVSRIFVRVLNENSSIQNELIIPRTSFLGSELT